MINQTNSDANDGSSKDEKSNEHPIENLSKDDDSKGNKSIKEEKTSYKNQLYRKEVPCYMPYPLYNGKKVPTWFHQWKTREERSNKLKELFKKLNSFDFVTKFPKKLVLRNNSLLGLLSKL